MSASSSGVARASSIVGPWRCQNVPLQSQHKMGRSPVLATEKQMVHWSVQFCLNASQPRTGQLCPTTCVSLLLVPATYLVQPHLLFRDFQ
jgi:hypothetical protein